MGILGFEVQGSRVGGRLLAMRCQGHRVGRAGTSVRQLHVKLARTHTFGRC